MLLAAPTWAQSAKPATVKLTDKQHIDFLVGDHPLGRYHIAQDLPKPHFHPVNGPAGKPLTRGYPMVKDLDETKDHPHHRAVWFCHGDVIVDGVELKSKTKGVEGVDFWSEASGHGRIVCTHAEAAGPGKVTTKNEWRTAEGVKVMDEVRTLQVFQLGESQLIVFDIDLHASVGAITFGDTKEGSFAIRVAETICEKKGAGGVIENAEGKKGEKACWGKASAWCDYSGPVDGTRAGLAILDHPKNASPVLWHSRSYGLMGANPFGRNNSGFPDAKGKTDLVKIAKGEHLKLRYGLLVHGGDAKEGKVAEHYQTFVKLP
jgi:hypothetical protein